MADSGFVLNEVENYAKLKPLYVMRQYEKMQSINENKTSSSEGKIETLLVLKTWRSESCFRMGVYAEKIQRKGFGRIPKDGVTWQSSFC